MNCEYCESNTDSDCDVVLNADCHIEAKRKIAELEASNAEYLKTCEDLTLDNIKYRTRAKDAEVKNG